MNVNEGDYQSEKIERENAKSSYLWRRRGKDEHQTPSCKHPVLCHSRKAQNVHPLFSVLLIQRDLISFSLQHLPDASSWPNLKETSAPIYSTSSDKTTRMVELESYRDSEEMSFILLTLKPAISGPKYSLTFKLTGSSFSHLFQNTILEWLFAK